MGKNHPDSSKLERLKKRISKLGNQNIVLIIISIFLLGVSLIIISEIWLVNNPENSKLLSSILGSIGKFLALVFGIHLIYDLIIKKIDRDEFLDEMKEQLEYLTPQFDYLKVQDEANPTNTSEADIYNRANIEIKKCKESVLIFTSYLPETSDLPKGEEEAKEKYFKTLLALTNIKDFRRIIQMPEGETIENFYGSADTSYQKHILDLKDKEEALEKT